MKYKLTWSLMALNVIIFEIIFSMPEPLFNSSFGLLDFSMVSSLQAWRWFTSLFMHASASHLFFNMLALFFFGRVLEDEIKPRQWLMIYFLSGIAGNLAFGLTSSMSAVGASGCIFGLMGAAMFLKPKKLIRIYVFPLPLGLIAILYILAQVTIAVMPGAGAQVAYMAHIGGLAAGGGLMFYFKPKAAMRGFLVMFLLLVLILLLEPFVLIIVDIGSMILGFFDLMAGFFLYGIAHVLLSWIW